MFSSHYAFGWCMKLVLPDTELHVCHTISKSNVLNVEQEEMSFVVPLPACDDECTGLLLNDLDRLNQMILSVNLSGPLPAPYTMLQGFENTTQELKVCWQYSHV